MVRAFFIVVSLLALVASALAGPTTLLAQEANSANNGHLAFAPAAATPAADLPAASPVAATAPVLPEVDPSSGALGLVFQQTRIIATALPPVAIDQSGSFVQIQDQYNVGMPSPEVNLADFYTIATFVNPSDLSTPVDVGIGFRADMETEIAWQVMLRSNGRWYQLQPGPQPIASGDAPSFDPAPGASNTIELIVQGENGFLAVNGLVLAQLDLSLILDAGSVYLGTGFIRADTVPDREVFYHDWWIYPLSLSGSDNA